MGVGFDGWKRYNDKICGVVHGFDCVGEIYCDTRFQTVLWEFRCLRLRLCGLRACN